MDKESKFVCLFGAMSFVGGCVFTHIDNEYRVFLYFQERRGCVKLCLAAEYFGTKCAHMQVLTRT